MRAIAPRNPIPTVLTVGVKLACRVSVKDTAAEVGLFTSQYERLEPNSSIGIRVNGTTGGTTVRFFSHCETAREGGQAWARVCDTPAQTSNRKPSAPKARRGIRNSRHCVRRFPFFRATFPSTPSNGTPYSIKGDRERFPALGTLPTAQRLLASPISLRT